MPATSTKVFILGATGYVGGAILSELLRTSASFKITALVRKGSDIELLEKLGVKTIQGSFSDVDKIEQASREADIVYNAADADDMELTKAVLKGLKSKQERGVLIQTSGTGLLSDNYNGELTPEGSKIWNDNDINDIKGIAPTQPHRNVDLEIFGAHEREEIDAYIIAPSCIYGIGDGPGNKISQQIPRLIRAAIEFKQPVYVGKGTNLWNNVHITDLVQLYALVLNLALSVRAGEATRPEAFANFYFGSVGEHAWGDIAKRLGPILLKRGKVEKTEARSIKADEVQNFSALATNSRSVAERSRKLGWTTVAKSLEDTLEEDVDAVLATLK
ncbi:NAD(P)-binding protein [Rhizoctonia solani]|nr:NAD(P)-binding protein [Rhizoctonia solani]